jgi:predicted ATPase
MAVKIIYLKSTGYELENFIKSISTDDDFYILSPNNWNDYGYVTMFDINIIKNKEVFSGMIRKILFDDQVEGKLNSRTRFDEYINNTKSTNLESFNSYYKFISLGSDYKELKELFPDDYQIILKRLNDVIYLQEEEKNSELLKLRDTEGFHVSLLRDQSFKKSLAEEGEFLFSKNYAINKDQSEEENITKQEIVLDLEKKINQFKFNFTLPNNNRRYEYHFSFHDKELPKRINVLIGKNGSGKSQTLKLISDFLVKRENDLSEYKIDVKTANKFGNFIDNDSIPFIQNTIVVAYNPYEKFLEYSPNIKDYSYLGFRRLQKANENIDLNFLSKISDGLIIYSYLYEHYDAEIKEFSLLKRYGLSYDLEELIEKVKENSKRNWNSEDLVKIIDLYLSNISNVITDINLPNKIIFKSFQKAYENDYNWLRTIKRLEGKSKLNAIFKYISDVIPEVCYISLNPIDPDRKDKLNSIKNEKIKYINDKIVLFNNEELISLEDLDFSDFEMKLTFLDSKFEEVKFSSGQEVFTNLIIYLISTIQKDSLIIIDEPENTLHPNFEVKYIEILNKLLEEYKSFCIIATHSSLIIREVPALFVKVIKIIDDHPIIRPPVINTFGADIGTITNYVFEDIYIEDKPHNEWILEQKNKYEDFEDFENVFREKLSYDFLVKCSNLWDEE